MSLKPAILECVPNFSEGINRDTLAQIADAIRGVSGVQLLHMDPSTSANRTVYTFAGDPDAVIEAAFQAIKIASVQIDMRKQKGIHPRIGATDVCPLVPLSGMSMEQAVDYSKQLAKRVGEELSIPVYLYEHSAIRPQRSTLPQIRRGEYEGLAGRVGDPDWEPDYGPQLQPDSSTGATVIGARDLLVAWNISLDTEDVRIAKHIASRLRESGYMDKSSPGNPIRRHGVFPKLRAIGWYQEDFEQAQLSMNFLDYRVSSPLAVWLACEKLAREGNFSLLGSELIGLIPRACLEEAGRYAIHLESKADQADEMEILLAGAKFLKLDQVRSFSVVERTLELALKHKGIFL